MVKFPTKEECKKALDDHRTKKKNWAEVTSMMKKDAEESLDPTTYYNDPYIKEMENNLAKEMEIPFYMRGPPGPKDGGPTKYKGQKWRESTERVPPPLPHHRSGGGVLKPHTSTDGHAPPYLARQMHNEGCGVGGETKTRCRRNMLIIRTCIYLKSI